MGNRVIPINLGRVNAFVITSPRGVVLVDCGFAGEEKKLFKALKEKGISKNAIKLIIITHAHPDHYGGASLLKNWLGVPVAIHEKDVEVVSTGVNYPIHAFGLLGRMLKGLVERNAEKSAKKFTPFTPDIIVEDRFDLSSYGIDGYIFPSPGETPGSISIALADGSFIVGDLFGPKIPFMSVPAYSPFPMDIEQSRKSISHLLQMQPVVCYTGHSLPIAIKRHFRRLSDMAVA